MSNQTQTDWASGVLNKLTNNGERIAVIEFKLDELNKKVDNKFDAIDSKFDEVDKRFDEVDKRFDEVDKRFDEVDKRFDGIEVRLGNIEAITGQVESALKWLKWIGGGVGAILLSIIANYVYYFFGKS